MCLVGSGSSWSRIKSGMIRHPKYRPYPPGFLIKPGMTRFLNPDSSFLKHVFNCFVFFLELLEGRPDFFSSEFIPFNAWYDFIA